MKIIALEEKLVKHLWLRTWNELKLPKTKVITTRISFTTLRTARTFNRNIMFTTGKYYSRKVEQYCHRKKKGRGLGRKKQWRNGCFMQMMMKMLLFMEVLQLKKHFHIHYDCWSSQKPYEIWLLFQFYKWVNRLKVLQLAHAILVIKYLIKICCSVTKTCLTLCNLMDCNTPGSSVLQYLLEIAQSNSPSNEYSGLISFRTDWLDLLKVQLKFRITENYRFKL